MFFLCVLPSPSKIHSIEKSCFGSVTGRPAKVRRRQGCPGFRFAPVLLPIKSGSALNPSHPWPYPEKLWCGWIALEVKTDLHSLLSFCSFIVGSGVGRFIHRSLGAGGKTKNPDCLHNQGLCLYTEAFLTAAVLT